MTSPAVLLIALYLRVSTEEQARKGYSLPEQREACRKRANALADEHQRAAGIPVSLRLVEFVDTFGGDIAERPVLEELRTFVRAHRPAWLVCMDPDRFSRSLKLQLIVADDIEAQQTRLAFVQQEYNPDDLMSKAFFQFRGLMSELDKAKILERTTRGKKGKLKAGKRPNGAAPYGYIHRKELDELQVYEPEARWVRAIFGWVIHDHLSLNQVTQRLNELGVPRKRHGAKWHRSVVGGLLRNTAYCGQMLCNRRDFSGLGSVRRLPPDRRKPLSARLRPKSAWVAIPVPAIISREEWEQAQANLKPAARRGGRRDTGLLSMLVRCGACGGPMAYARHAGGRHYLRCQRRYGPAGADRCRNPHHRARSVEQTVWTELLSRLLDPSLLEAYLAGQQSPIDLAGRLGDTLHALQDRLAAEHRLQAVTVRRQAEGKLAVEVADAMLAESAGVIQQIEAELTLLQQRMAALSASGGQADDAQSGDAATPHRVAAELDLTRRQLASLGPDRRRELVLKVIRQVTVMPDGTAHLALREQ